MHLGVVWRVIRGCQGVLRGFLWCILIQNRLGCLARVYFVSETAQVELWAIVSPYEDLGGVYDGLSSIDRNFSVELSQLTSGLEDLSISRRFNVRALVLVSCGLQGMEGGGAMREVRYCQLAANALASRQRRHKYRYGISCHSAPQPPRNKREVSCADVGFTY